MRKARFQIYVDPAGKYRWRLLAVNGLTVASSGESFASKYDAKRAAANVKTVAAEAELTG
jgi:uncharacterized protein YegP (UPF0339 family)